MSGKTRTVGSLTHADFGKTIRVQGYPEGVLWGIQHVAAFGDIKEPWTRVTICRMNKFSEASRGLPPTTPVLILPDHKPEGNPR